MPIVGDALDTGRISLQSGVLLYGTAEPVVNDLSVDNAPCVVMGKVVHVDSTSDLTGKRLREAYVDTGVTGILTITAWGENTKHLDGIPLLARFEAVGVARHLRTPPGKQVLYVTGNRMKVNGREVSSMAPTAVAPYVPSSPPPRIPAMAAMGAQSAQPSEWMGGGVGQASTMKLRCECGRIVATLCGAKVETGCVVARLGQAATAAESARPSSPGASAARDDSMELAKETPRQTSEPSEPAPPSRPKRARAAKPTPKKPSAATTRAAAAAAVKAKKSAAIQPSESD